MRFFGYKDGLKAKSINVDKDDVDSPLLPPPSPLISPIIRGVACVLGGALAHFTFGSLYCWGNFSSYAPYALRSDYIFPLTVVSQCLTMPFGPIIAKKLGSRYALLLGCWIMASGVYLASYATDLPTFTFCYSVMFGCGIGIAYAAPMMAGWSWMPNSKGLVSGAILTGFGLGGFFFNIIGTNIVNPKGIDQSNGKFPHEIYAQFPIMLRRLAFTYACISLFGAMLITQPALKVTVEDDEEGGYENDKDKILRDLSTEVLGVTIKEALHTSQFWLMWLMIITSASAGLNVASMYKQFAAVSPALKGDAYQALTGGMGALFNGFGRLFWGSICDRIGFKASFTILTIAQAFIQLMYPYSERSKALFLSINCLCYFCLAGNFAMMPPAIQRMFGSKNGALIYGVIYSAFGTAALVTMLFSKAMIIGFGWTRVFHVLASVSIFAAYLTSLLKPLASLPSSTV